MLDSVGKLSVTVCIDTRSGGSPERCLFSDDRFLESTEKLHVQTRESTDDIFAVALCKMGLEKSSRGQIKGIHTRKRFSRSGIWRMTMSLSSCTKYEAKKAKKSKTTAHLYKHQVVPAPCHAITLSYVLPNPILGRKPCDVSIVPNSPVRAPSPIVAAQVEITENIYGG